MSETKPDSETSRDPNDRPMLGIVLIIASVMLLPIMDGIGKSLSDTYQAMQIVWGRFVFQGVLVIPIALWMTKGRMFNGDRWPLQIARGACLMGATWCFYQAVRHISIADTLALVYFAPILVTAASPFLLGEKVGLRRWLAAILGFVGVLVILRPGLGAMHPSAIWGVGAAFCFASYVLLTRRLSTETDPMVTLAFTSIVGIALATAFSLPTWVAPSAEDLMGMAGMGLISAIGHYLMVRAYMYGPASLLTPFIYCEMAMAVLVGYIWFNDFPDAWVWGGIVILVISGIYISLREQAAKREEG